jgi:O-succinylbenzoic acid--CoA ligase
MEEWNSDVSYVIVHTSGSTGKPKEILIPKEHMIISARKTLDYFSISPGQNALLCLSPDTIAGKMMIVRSIVGNLNLFVVDVNSNPLNQLSDKIDFVALVPIQVEEILNIEPLKLKKIQTILIGGGPISNVLSSKLNLAEIQAYHSYGMTETISHVAIRPVGKLEKDTFEALNGIEFSTKDQQLVVHYPEIGHLLLTTNDIVELVDKQQFKFIGRSDFMINSGGVKLNPETIENLLSAMIKAPYFVAGIEDQNLGQKLILVIEGTTSQAPTLLELKSVLPKYHDPKEMYFIPKFVRTESDKINRGETLKLIHI